MLLHHFCLWCQIQYHTASRNILRAKSIWDQLLYTVHMYWGKSSSGMVYLDASLLWARNFNKFSLFPHRCYFENKAWMSVSRLFSQYFIFLIIWRPCWCTTELHYKRYPTRQWSAFFRQASSSSLHNFQYSISFNISYLATSYSSQIICT